tara:strand:- start:11750 stop:12103 length:354 start_codon:yes stop_codon:yes gene_type:complete
MRDYSNLNPPKRLLDLIGAKGDLLSEKEKNQATTNQLTSAQVKKLQRLINNSQDKGIGSSGIRYTKELKEDGVWGREMTKAWRYVCQQAKTIDDRVKYIKYPNYIEVNNVLTKLGVR